MAVPHLLRGPPPDEVVAARVDPRADRFPVHDERSRGYLLRELLDDPAALERRRGSWLGAAPRTPLWRPARPTLDQGREGACVGFSLATLRNASPHRLQPAASNERAREWYHEFQRNDEWAGEAYEGTTVLAGLQTLRRLGLISEFRWLGAGSGRLREDVQDCLRRWGPFVAGVPVYESMSHPLPDGSLRVDPSSRLLGYHAICNLSLRVARLMPRREPAEYVTWQNTWGDSWGARWFGVGGCAHVLLDDLVDVLLNPDNWGEAAAVTEVLAA